MHPKGLSDAGAEAICLNQCTNKRTDVVNSGAVDEVTESLGAGLAGTHLEVHEMELVAEVGVGMVQVLADPGQCLVEGKAGFDANDRKIQGIGQPQADPVLPVTNHSLQDESGKEKAETGNSDQQEKIVEPGKQGDADKADA